MKRRDRLRDSARPTSPDQVDNVAISQKLADDKKAVLSALLVEVGRGDEYAFGELYDSTSDMVYGLILRLLRDPSQAEEVTQEVFVEVWRQAPRFDSSRGSVTGWMATMAHRRAVDRIRSEQAHRNRNEAEGRKVEPEHDSASEIVIDRLEHAEVVGLLDSLNPNQREAVQLAYFGGYTYREVAVLLNIAEGTAKGRIRDGLIKLREQMGVAQ